MAVDLLDRIDEVTEIGGSLITGGFWLLAALFSVFMSLRDRTKKRRQGGTDPSTSNQRSLPAPRPQTTLPSPFSPAPATRPDSSPVFTTSDAPEASRMRSRDTRDAATPVYGSRDKAVWGSVFDEPGERIKWGFDESEWGSSFGPKKDSEPTVSQG